MSEKAAAKLTVGELIAGRYRMVAPIAQGGMGSVWKAHDERAFGQAVAIKVVRAVSASESVKKRFVEEAKVISTLNSPHIVGLREYGTTESNYPFFVMDLLEGQTVTERLATEGACSERDGARILDGLLAGLQELHLQGVIHRDLKPSNVFLEQSSAIDAHVRILDLGIAQLVDGGASTPRGRQKRVVGTPRWMAPEVLLGEPASQVSDLYSVGLLGVLILGGEIPHSRFASDGSILPFDRSCIIQRLGSNSVKVTGRRGMEPISDAFCHLLEDALWREPEDRYRDALEFRIALRKALPHLGMPSLPFANGGRSSRNISVPTEHTLLEDGLSPAFENSVAPEKINPVEVLDGAQTRKMSAGAPESSVDSNVLGIISDSPMSETRPLKAQESIDSAPESTNDPEDEINFSSRLKPAPFGVGLLAVLGGIALGWIFLSEPQNGSEPPLDSDAKEGGRPSAVLPELQNGTGMEVEHAVVGTLDMGVKAIVPDALLAVKLDAEPVKLEKKAPRVTKKKTSRKKKLKPPVVRQSAVIKAADGLDTLGKRCRTQFKEIVRDSDGGTLVKSSPLCGRIGTLVKEAVKPKCGLTSKQRKDLNMLEVLCESNP